MKRLTVLIVVFAILSFKGNGQEISYGSNQGKHIKLSGTKIYYEEYGSGVPLLLLHGGFGSIHDFQEVIPELANHYRIIAIDSPGHGRSEQADSLSFELMSAYCSELIDAFKLDSVYIIGYSDGGITALLLAEKRPEKVKKIIASGANSRMSGLRPETLGFIDMINPDFIEVNMGDWLVDYKSKSPEKDEWKKFITDLLKMYSAEVLISEQTLSNIRAKVLLVFGDRDLVKLEHGIELYHTISGSELCILPDTPHEVFSASPELFSTIGLEFLTR